MTGTEETFEWRFHRIGGLDQVTLRTSEELRHLDELDPKLWVVLSCPVADLQFDQRTLALLDTDADGRIGVQEVLAAVLWQTARLKNPAEIAERPQTLRLSSIRDDTPEGRRLIAAAQQVLQRRGRPNAAELSQEHVVAAVETLSKTEFNGDGVIPLRPDLPPTVTAFISDVMATLGSVPEAGGGQGVNSDLAQRFMREIRTLHQWQETVAKASAAFPLGSAAPQAFAAYRTVKEKIEDYFLRCALAAVDPGSAQALNPSAEVLGRLAAENLGADDAPVASLPLARIEAGQPLPLYAGINPSWSGAIAAFREQTVKPLLGDLSALTGEQWEYLKELFTPYGAVVASKPDTVVEKLGPERIAALADGKVMAEFEALAARDLAAQDEIGAVQDLERLVLYHIHLHRLLMNFVSFCDFYSLSLPTTFQIGKLYIDGRSCNVCVRVQDIERHANQARLSGLCLIYCECTRKQQTGKMNIAAAITDGDAELLIAGRHGVFVDIAGEAWDAVLVKLVDNPISIRAAVSAPYRRIGRAVTDQIRKLTADKDNDIVTQASKSLANFAKTPLAAAQPFDLGRSMGIFAAVGLALGAIGTALASIASSVLSLFWWQIPLLFLGIFLLISGPSAFLAWLKLRKRTLGPVLDASGWAVNSQIPINITMGHFLTGSASLPPNIRRSLNDPFRKPQKWKKRLLGGLALAMGLVLAVVIWWGRHHWDDLWEKISTTPTVHQEAAEPQKK